MPDYNMPRRRFLGMIPEARSFDRSAPSTKQSRCLRIQYSSSNGAHSRAIAYLRPSPTTTASPMAA